MPRSRTRPSRQKKSFESVISLLVKLGIAATLIMIMVGITVWLLWQQIQLPSQLQALLLVDENRQPHQLIVSRFASSARSIMIVAMPIDEQLPSSLQDADFTAQIMLQVGLPLEELQTLSASPYTSAAEVLQLLRFHPPQNLGYWEKLKWQWYLDHQDYEVQLLSSTDEVTNSSLVKQLRSNANFTCSVAIVNTTERPGLASAVATSIENGGKRVVQITSTAGEYPQSQVFFDKESCQNVAKEVSNLTPGKFEPQRNPSVTLQYRADTVIFLGKDFSQFEPAD